MLGIGHISYANCTPIFYILRRYHDCSNYTFLKGVPSEVNRLLLKGELDASPSSSIELARHSELYLFLSDLSISSFGKVGSIILFSKVPIERLNREKIATAQASTTSAILLRIIMSEFLRIENTFYEESGGLKAVLKKYKAFLLIGDDALKTVQSSKFKVQSLKSNNSELLTPNSELYLYDLGELWYKFTQLPFVFALWLVRKDSFKNKKDEVEILHRSLISAKEIASRDLTKIAEEAEERNWITQESLLDYWKGISYDLTDTHLEGLRRFYGYAKGLSLIKEVPRLEENIIPLTHPSSLRGGD